MTVSEDELDEFEENVNKNLYTLDPAIINSFPYNIDWSRLCEDEKNLPLLEEYVFAIKNYIVDTDFDISILSTKPWAVEFLSRNIDLIEWSLFSINPAAADVLRKNPSKIDYWIILNPNPELNDIKEIIKKKLSDRELKELYNQMQWYDVDININILREAWPYILKRAHEKAVIPTYTFNIGEITVQQPGTIWNYASKTSGTYTLPSCIFKYPEFYDDVLNYFETHWKSIPGTFVLKSYYDPCYIEIIKKYPSVLKFNIVTDYDLLIEEIKH